MKRFYENQRLTVDYEISTDDEGDENLEINVNCAIGDLSQVEILLVNLILDRLTEQLS